MLSQSSFQNVSWLSKALTLIAFAHRTVGVTIKDAGRPQRSYPDIRRLTELNDEGHINERLCIKFEPIDSTTVWDPAIERQIMDLRAQNVMIHLDGLCTECRPAIPSGGKFESDHVAAGLHLHYVCDCPSSSITTLEEDIFTTSTPNNISSTNIQNVLEAIGKLMTIVKREREDQLEESESQASSSEGVLGIAILDAEYAVETTEFNGEIPSSPTINEYDHPALWARQQRRLQQQYERKLQYSQDPSDKYFKQGDQSHYAAIGLSSAWEYMASQNGWNNARQTIVHVGDTGWDLTHEDSGLNKWVNNNEICGNGIDDDNNGYVDDCYGYNFGDKTGNNNIVGNTDHGSHVSGIIAANTDNNGIGVAGVAGGARNGAAGHGGVSIMTGVNFGASGSRAHAESLVYAADHGAHISSNSWKYKIPNFYNAQVKDAIDYAVNKGVLIVFAAGNDNSNNPYYPASFPDVLSVTATDNNGLRAPFANYGERVDIAAPGVNVVSTGFNNQYIYKSGTSFSCPQVSAVLAMGKSIKPSATTNELKSCLLGTADTLDDEGMGAGMVNPRSFLECLNPAVVVESPTQDHTTSVPITTEPIPAPTLPLPVGGDDPCLSCGNCLLEHGGKGCECSTCEQIICAADNLCCSDRWDHLCVEDAQAFCHCGTPTPPAGDGNNDVICPNSCGNCLLGRAGEVGCECKTCEQTICAADPFCCSHVWDSLCAEDAQKCQCS